MRERYAQDLRVLKNDRNYKMKKLLSNFLYQSVYQVVKIVIPLLTVPIVSRALGPENIGIFKYAGSVVSYFVLFATLGTIVYGQRQVAMARDSKAELSRQFWEIETMTIISSSLVMIVYSVFCYANNLNSIFWLQLLVIVSTLLDISWFFMGIEDFKITSLRSLVFSILTFFCIILFVKNKSDLLTYVLINTIGSVLQTLVMWPFLRKKIYSIKKEYILGSLKHFKPTLVFFLPTISVALYNNVPITFLGFLGLKKDVAFFSNAITMNMIITTCIGIADAVLLPNLTHLFSIGKRKKIEKVLSKTLNYQFFFSIAAVALVLVIGPKFIYWFMGEEFMFVALIQPAVTLIILFKLQSISIGKQYLIPFGKMRNYNFSTILGSLISVVFSIVLIPTIGIWGAVISLMAAELLVFITRYLTLKKETTIRYDFVEIAKYLASAIPSGIIVYCFTRLMKASISTTIIQIALFTIGYLLSIVILRAKITKEVFDRFKINSANKNEE